MKSRYRIFRMAGAVLLVQALAFAGTATRLRVTHIPGAPVYKAPVLGQPIMVLPLNTLVDGEVKQGEFWKITVDKDGVKTTGYVHEFLVEEVSGSGLEEGAAPVGSSRTQAELVAEIELKIEENKNLIRQQSNLPQAVEDLRSLIPKVFGLEDPQKQKQIACDIYLWTGHAFAKQDDDAGAIKEFRSMFEVDYLTAKRATEYTADTYISQLIDTAEKKYNGTFVGYILQIDTEPKEAVLKIDGKVIGRSPNVYTTDQPKVTLEIEKEGYKPEKFLIALKDAKNFKSYVLQSLGRVFRVGSDPAGAAVFLDGRDTGKVTDCDLAYVPYGLHRLTIKKDGFADWEEEVNISEGTDPFTKIAVLTARTYSPAFSWGGPGSKTFLVPKALALDKDGNFYVADEGPFKVRKYGPDHLAFLNWGAEGKAIKSLKLASGIAVAADGACYITDARSGNLSKFDKDGQFLRKWGDAGSKETMLNQPLGVAVDGNNDIYVVDSGNGRIVKYSPSGGQKKTWGKPGAEQGQFQLPTGIAVNSRGEIIVVEAARIQKFTSDGVFIAAFGKPGSGDGELKRCLAVCCDKYDNIFVADGGNNRVCKFSPNGKFIGSFGGVGAAMGQMAAPIGVVMGANGSVFVLERDNGRIQEFRPPSK
jgi:DNA-binding beta-propeller fold protein YncE